MAKFKQAFQKTMGSEGGYSNDSDDAGKETYKGISRRYHPSWRGWKIIDGIKAEIFSGSDRSETALWMYFTATLEHSKDLQAQVCSFYKAEFWDKFCGDVIRDQSIAEELFDTAVNMNHTRAVTFLQKSLNLLNRNQKNFADIVEDGDCGNKTFGALRQYLKKDSPDFLLKLMNVYQGAHYIAYMRRSPIQEKYARGWLGRVEIKKYKGINK